MQTRRLTILFLEFELEIQRQPRFSSKALIKFVLTTPLELGRAPHETDLICLGLFLNTVSK
jgi:hypothetical protein